ncbi:MAG: RHS repeat-associated core domain-containing protein, partial [Fimbriiglobus sp.]
MNANVGTTLIRVPQWAGGVCVLRSRSYNPAAGRFLSMDPFAGNMGDTSQWMRYGYAGANPVANTDPSGLSLTSTLVGFANSFAGRALILSSIGAVTWGLFSSGPASRSEARKINNGDLHYYENLGWVDVTHVKSTAFAKKILTSIKNESGDIVGGYHKLTFQ